MKNAGTGEKRSLRIWIISAAPVMADPGVRVFIGSTIRNYSQITVFLIYDGMILELPFVPCF